MKNYYETFKHCIAFAMMFALVFTACKKQDSTQTSTEMTLEQKIARFAPTDISADISKLSSDDKKALDKIIESARLMDPIFLRQVWRGNVDLLRRLETDTTEAGQEKPSLLPHQYGTMVAN